MSLGRAIPMLFNKLPAPRKAYAILNLYSFYHVAFVKCKIIRWGAGQGDDFICVKVI